jgi:hypothetical protein
MASKTKKRKSVGEKVRGGCDREELLVLEFAFAVRICRLDHRLGPSQENVDPDIGTELDATYAKYLRHLKRIELLVWTGSRISANL